MRVKSEARRQAILDVAAEVFREHGFEHASMSEMTARLGGSKSTLYQGGEKGTTPVNMRHGIA